MPKTRTSTPGRQLPDNPQSIHRIPIINGSAPNAEPAFDPPAPLPESVPTPASPIEELDLDSYRVNQDFSEYLQAGKRPVVIPVGRPPRQEWVLFNPSGKWRQAFNLLEDEMNRHTYVVAKHLVPDVLDDLKPKLLVAYTTWSHTWGLWPLRLPGEDGDLDSFNTSAHAITIEYAGRWVRVLTNKPGKVYTVIVPKEGVVVPVPTWPEGGFNYLFQLAFRGRVINDLDHPVIQRLQGRKF
jgi:hypothetical protein